MGDMIDRDAVLAVIKQQVELWEKGTLVCGLDDLLHLYLPQAIAELPAVTVGVKDFDVQVVRGNTGGNLALYFNDYRVAGSKPWGGGTTIHQFRVQGDDAKSSGILATIWDFQTVPVVKECLTTDAALPTVTVGVKPLVWVEDFADHPFGWYETIDCGDCIVLTQSGVAVGSLPTTDAAKAAAQADYETRILAALEPVTQPAPDAAAIRAAALREAHDAIADYPRVSPDSTEAQHYDEQIEHCQSIILALITEKPHDR